MIIDTNALSAFVDGKPGIGEVVRTHRRPAIPVIVLGEYRYGIAGSRHRKTYEDWLDANLQQFDVLDITTETTVFYALLRAALKKSGQPIPANDAWIAALALQHRIPILSRDEHFDALPDVLRIGW